MKKNSFINFFKKKIVKVYLADLIFFSLLLWFLVYAHNRIFSYLLVIQQFSPKLMDVSSVLSSDISSVSQLDVLLKVIEPIVQEANFFVYFVIPILIFLLWVLFQGLSWNLLKEDSIKRAFDIRFYPKFALVSLPFFVVIFYLFNDFLKLSENVNPTKSIITWVFLFIVFYFTVMSYLLIGKSRFFLNVFNIAFKRIKIFFPAFLLFLIIMLLSLIIFFNAYISALSMVFPSSLSILLLMFFILLFSSSKCLLVFLSE